MKELLRKIWKKDWTEEEKLIIMAMMASFGVILGLTCGFVISPVKNGLSVFSGNGCNNDGNGCANKDITKNRHPKKDCKAKKEHK